MIVFKSIEMPSLLKQAQHFAFTPFGFSLHFTQKSYISNLNFAYF